MKQFTPLLSASTLALAMCAAMLPASTQANPIGRYIGGNASNFCQSALPVFDVQIRKRPLSVQNEGTTSAFVTCSFNTAGKTEWVQVSFHSSAETPSTMTCTAIYGINDGQASYLVKDIALPGGGIQISQKWLKSEFSVDEESNGEVGISCYLAPGMGIDNSYARYTEEI